MPDPPNLAFAELLKDPKASFPRAFTICSTAMASNMDTKTSSGYIALFTLTGLDDLPYLTGLYDKDQNGSFGLVSGTFYSKEEAEIPKVFPEHWLSSCIAVNTESGEDCWLVNDNEDKLILLLSSSSWSATSRIDFVLPGVAAVRGMRALGIPFPICPAQDSMSVHQLYPYYHHPINTPDSTVSPLLTWCSAWETAPRLRLQQELLQPG